MTQIVCVLRSGGIYTPEWVQRLAKGLKQWGWHSLLCLTDMQVPGVPMRPLQYDWPGWWSKMEVMNLPYEEDVLFLDLDTAVTGPMDEILETDGLILLRDFYRPDGLGSGVMRLPYHARREAWRAWIADPEGHMAKHGGRGDQAFLETLWLNSAKRWQDEVPGQIVSYKADRCSERLPTNARLVCWHGKPKPTECRHDWMAGWN